MRWYAIYTKPRAEEQAQFHLGRQFFGKVYLPAYRKRRRHARRVDWVAAPLFPRYLFLQMDIAVTQWRAIRSTVGVVDIVRHCDTPLAVPHGVIDSIRAREDEQGLVEISPEIFEKDCPVRIRGGAFADQCGVFQCVNDADRVVVLLNLLGRQVRVQVSSEQLERAV
jgi:transcriptional antiterminator RfaH